MAGNDNRRGSQWCGGNGGGDPLFANLSSSRYVKYRRVQTQTTFLAFLTFHTLLFILVHPHSFNPSDTRLTLPPDTRLTSAMIVGAVLSLLALASSATAVAVTGCSCNGYSYTFTTQAGVKTTNVSQAFAQENATEH